MNFSRGPIGLHASRKHCQDVQEDPQPYQARAGAPASCARRSTALTTAKSRLWNSL